MSHWNAEEESTPPVGTKTVDTASPACDDLVCAIDEGGDFDQIREGSWNIAQQRPTDVVNIQRYVAPPPQAQPHRSFIRKGDAGVRSFAADNGTLI